VSDRNQRVLHGRLCVVCGSRPAGQWMQSTDGDIWCLSHERLPKCMWCGLPARASTPLGVRCERCSGGAVDVATDLREPLHQVGAHMAAFGLNIDQRVTLVLRPISEMRARGLFEEHAPHQLGVTRWQTSAQGHVVGPITIGIIAGLPRLHFRRVLAHEYAHALFVAWPAARSVPDVIAEGFAEVLAAEHLAGAGSGAAGRRLVQQMATNPDPIYGGGFRLVRPAVHRHGLSTVLDALRHGRRTRVGLP
jgi:hypothetical protein